jgi:GntR family transcriptional regulator
MEGSFKNYRDAPLIERIRNDLRDAIARGSLKPGEKLSSEPELAASLGVSRNSLREALGLLESEGLLARRRGVGTFVVGSGPVVRGGIERLRSISDLISEQGYEPGNEVLRYETAPCDAIVAARLRIPEGSRIAILETLKRASGRPVALCIDYAPSELLGEGANPEAMKTSIFDYLWKERGIEILFAECDLVPILADRALASKLDTPRRGPILLLEAIHVADGESRTLFSRSYFPAGAFVFKLVRRR